VTASRNTTALRIRREDVTKWNQRRMNAARISVTEDTLQLTVVAHDTSQIFNLDNVPPVELKIVLQKCAWCEKPFIQSTSYQKFCSVRCRVTAHRKCEPEPNVQQFYERAVISEQDALRALAG